MIVSIFVNFVDNGTRFKLSLVNRISGCMSVAGGEAVASHWERVRMRNRGAGDKPDEGIWFFAAKRGWRSDERALGIAAEMIFGMGRMRYVGRMRYARTCKVVFAGAYRIRPTAMDAKNHWSGKPDGAAENNNDREDRNGLA